MPLISGPTAIFFAIGGAHAWKAFAGRQKPRQDVYPADQVLQAVLLGWLSEMLSQAGLGVVSWLLVALPAAMLALSGYFALTRYFTPQLRRT